MHRGKKGYGVAPVSPLLQDVYLLQVGHVLGSFHVLTLKSKNVFACTVVHVL
jgi:hypothetical protein